MKEYAIQAKVIVNGEESWVPAKTAYGTLWRMRPYQTHEEAEKGVVNLIQHFVDYAKYVKKENCPAGFRIVSREVTEWKVELG